MNGRLAVVGGGAAGFFAAITCAEAAPGAAITLYEKGPEFLQKVRISGGGRCNVTHACFEPRELVRRYPRGEKELIGPFHQFQAADTVRWFESRGVKLKTEADGRMFPATDRSQTIIDCLIGSAKAAGIRLVPNRAVQTVGRHGDGFRLSFADGDKADCDKLLLATGGCRSAALGALSVCLGHTLEPPVPSLFTFHIESGWVRSLAGLSVASVTVSVPGTKLRETGPLLFTHWGLSGPVVLRLSAWGARELQAREYRFPLEICWLPGASLEALSAMFNELARQQGARLVQNAPAGGLPARLWVELVREAGISPERRWSALPRAERDRLGAVLLRMPLAVSGKSLNKDEFVTCGGVRLREVNFKTMESKICPGLYFAGELLDIDGITGGFNFQAAWTTGWLAGKAIAATMC